MQTRLQVLAAEVLQSKAGKQYQVLQCVLHGNRLQVGTLRVYGELAKEPIAAGNYTAEFDWEVGFGDRQGELQPRMTKLNPLPLGAAEGRSRAAVS